MTANSVISSRAKFRISISKFKDVPSPESGDVSDWFLSQMATQLRLTRRRSRRESRVTLRARPERCVPAGHRETAQSCRRTPGGSGMSKWSR